jgi:hypothetical protein
VYFPEGPRFFTAIMCIPPVVREGNGKVALVPPVATELAFTVASSERAELKTRSWGIPLAVVNPVALMLMVEGSAPAIAKWLLAAGAL